MKPIQFFASVTRDHYRAKMISLPDTKVLRWAALIAIILLAGWLRFSNLSALGFANHYYAAAVDSMMKSWHNFFFVAAEPGGSVSVDKPPVGLWLQTISALIFGLNGFSILLPQILAGMMSVVVVYHLARRSFGTTAGLLSALVLAITPVVVATDRNNTIDSTLILTLLLAAWAFIKATETSKLRYLLLGAALVGIGFNIKMLEAYLPLPAFFALYFLGSTDRLGKKIAKLSLTTVVLLVISLSWITIVDLTPASQRPYVGSSGDNSEWTLAIGYNGINRLLGMARGLRTTSPASAAQNAPFLRPGGAMQNGGFNPPAGVSPNGFFSPQNNPGRQFRPGGFGGRGGGFAGTGQAGLLRFFTQPLSKEMSWLLPLGLFSMLLLFFSTKLAWPLAKEHQTLVIWGGWLLTGGIFFSIAGFFHQYYLSNLGPSLAILVGVGAILLWKYIKQHPIIGTSLLLAAAGITIVFQVFTAQAFVNQIGWLPWVLVLYVIGTILMIVAVRNPRQNIAAASMVCIIASTLVTPGVWSALTMLNSSDNQSLPAAYSGRPSGPANGGQVQVNQALLNYLQANTQNTYYLMAVPSSMQGADYVLATGRPVLYLGGFMGQDEVETPDQLAALIAQGRLRYVYWSPQGGPGNNSTNVSGWVSQNCSVVTGFDTNTQNSGAPDGTSARQNNNNNNSFNGTGGGQMRVSLYDCGG